jgi:hypothetical protein
MPPTILSRRYAPAVSVQSVVLPSRFRVASYYRRVGLWTWCATTTASAAAASTVRYARRPRRTLYLHDCQRASRKLSVHAVALCALCTPLYCPGATRPRQACSQSSYLKLSGCQLLSVGRSLRFSAFLSVRPKFISGHPIGRGCATQPTTGE